MGSNLSIGNNVRYVSEAFVFSGRGLVAALRHCEERSDEAIHMSSDRHILVRVDCFGRASLAMTATASHRTVTTASFEK